jgi:Inosine-uridine preferring nucleoside hydrolase
MRVAGNEPAYSRAEWNVYVDAAAASRVLRSGIPTTFVPLDASNNVPVTTFFKETVQAHPRTPALRIIGTMLRDPYITQIPGYFWDPLTAVAAAAAAGQQVVQLRAARLVIGTVPGPDLGITRINPSGTPVRLAMSASAPAFERQFLATLNGGQPVPVAAVPASQRLAVGYDGHTYGYLGPHTAAAGQVEIRLANRSPVPLDGFHLVIGSSRPAGHCPTSRRSSALARRPAFRHGSR